MESEKLFIEAEDYLAAKDKVVTFREIVLKHLQTITKLCTKELIPGYWQEKAKPFGTSFIKEKFYIEDGREAVSNAVDIFAHILFPHFDKVMIKDETDLDKEIDKELSDRDLRLANRLKLFRKLNTFLYRKKYLELREFKQ